jgi:hypothetical protein
MARAPLAPSLPRGRPAGLALALAAVLLCACDAGPRDPSTAEPAPAPEDVAQRLQGTWLREFAAEGVKSRRVLVLEPQGRFRERVRLTDATGAVSEVGHEGTWLYDGTNLKRKYTLMNGRPPSRLNLPFATFAIQFRSRNEFVGVDHIHKNEIVYRRVNPETEP